MKKALVAAFLLTLGWSSLALAQDKLKIEPAPAKAVAPAQSDGIKSQNILDVKPDASDDPGYAKQTNAERAKVQPGNNAPVWRQVGSGVTGYSSLPALEAGNLIQPFVQYPGSRMTNAGEAWREVRNNWIIPFGAALLAITALAMAIFYFTKGRLGHEHSDPARIERFTPFERAAHWANAFAFCALAISGFIMAFGKFFLLPIIGSSLFGWLTFVLKNLHNFTGPLFAVSLLIIVLMFVKDNIAGMADFVWLSKAGGMLSDHEVPSHRFNAGEKGMFWWGVTVPGLVAVGSGLVLDKLIPGFGDVRSEMQIAQMIHAVVAIWMIALISGHIYMGTVGVRGAYKGMKTGYVSDGWAREHHELWYNDIKAGKIPAQRSQTQTATPGPTVQA
jgi:formate dehydrogenase subunit gamma